MEKINVKIEFSRVITYSINTEISLEDFELIKDLDCEDVPMYVKENGDKWVTNDAYDILNEYATVSNEYDLGGEELLNVTVEDLND